MHKLGILPATSPAHSLARLSASSAFVVSSLSSSFCPLKPLLAMSHAPNFHRWEAHPLYFPWFWVFLDYIIMHFGLLPWIGDLLIY